MGFDTSNFNFLNNSNNVQPLNDSSFAWLDNYLNKISSSSDSSSSFDGLNLFDTSSVLTAGTPVLPPSGTYNSLWGSLQDIWNSAIGNKENPGWLNPVTGLLQAGSGFLLGSKQLGLASDQLDEAKKQFSDQFNAQKQQVNTDIYNQGKEKYAFDPVNNLDPNAYYDKNKI